MGHANAPINKFKNEDMYMKKTVKIILISCMIISLTLISNKAMASFAEWDDKSADQKKNEEIKEQEERDKENLGKSSNNFLKSLSIDGIELSPKFDKQTVEYEITKEIDDDEIEVKAEAEDTRATVNGTGIVKLKKGNNTISIEVVAENQTSRTYKISLKKSGTDTPTGEKQEVNEVKDPMTFNTTSDVESKDSKENNNIKTYVGIVGGITILVVLYVLTNSKKRKGKHR